MNDAELFFIGEAIRHARTLTFGDAMQFLDGMAATLGTGHPAHNKLAVVRNYFTNADAQLELIATGQLRMDLEQ